MCMCMCLFMALLEQPLSHTPEVCVHAHFYGSKLEQPQSNMPEIGVHVRFNGPKLEQPQSHIPEVYKAVEHDWGISMRIHDASPPWHVTPRSTTPPTAPT